MLIQLFKAPLCVLSQHGATFVAQENAAGPICVSQPIGKEEPFHCTASGKVMLAYLPEPLRETLIAGIGFERFTERTISSREELEAQFTMPEMWRVDLRLPRIDIMSGGGRKRSGRRR